MTKPFILLIRVLGCIFVITYSNIVFSQNQTNNWYFGNNAGFNFANGYLRVLTDGAMQTPEGCSTISDEDGNLLFYSNGATVWNRNHDIMENGDGLAGEITNNQSVFIVGLPKGSEKFYVFKTRITTTFDGNFQAGLYYSEIEISDEFPLGKVTKKNIFLRPKVTERIAASYNPKDNTVSVVVFGKALNSDDAPYDTFFVYKIGTLGFVGGTNSSQQIATDGTNGAMKISPNNQYIAMADFEGTAINIYNFDINSSTITYRESFETFVPFGSVPCYGLEFSPNSKVLYFNSTKLIFKYSIDPVDGFERRKLISFGFDVDLGSMQLARNGKIYIAGESSEPYINKLSVINFPDNFDEDSGVESLSVSLRTGGSRLGLPTLLASELRNRIIAENKCSNESISFDLDTFAPIDSVLWEFGDGQSSTELNPLHKYDRAGDFMVKATITMGTCVREVFKEIEAYEVPDPIDNQSLTQCVLDGDQPIFYNLFEIQDKLGLLNREYTLKFYESYENATDDIEEIVSPDIYLYNRPNEELFAKIESPEGCTDITNFYLETVAIRLEGIDPIFGCESTDRINGNNQSLFDLRSKIEDLKTQFSLDDTVEIKFYESSQDAQLEKDPLPFNYASGPNTIWVRIEDGENDCSGLDSFELHVSEPINLNIEERYMLCYDPIQSSVVLDGGIGNDKWEWMDDQDNIISTDRIFSTTESGRYSVTAYRTQNGYECSRTEYFLVLDAGESSIKSLSKSNGSISIELDAIGDYEFSLDGQDYVGSGRSHVFDDIRGGIYTVYARDIAQCEKPIEANISIISFPKFVTPNGDGYNDRWKVYGISKEFYETAKISIFDRYGKILYTMDIKNNFIGWDGLFSGKRLVSNDYWFEAKLIDIQGNLVVETGHFTLKY